ncbi:hypothetical protein DM785_02630 [Deinococcus actinosclerus]|nr:hypothetical protein DM785_02630 [Deinococcus actinosclerus]
MNEIDTLGRLNRLALFEAWFRDRAYEREDFTRLYPGGDETEYPLLRVPTAAIITGRHLGLELKSPPVFRVQNKGAQDWLTRVLKLNGLRGAMRAAAVQKSWAGDVGALFAWKPSEQGILGTPWQVGFIAPNTYEVTETYASGVFKAVDVYTYADEPNASTGKLERWWTRTQYRHDVLRTWPRVRGDVGTAARPDAVTFDAQVVPNRPVVEQRNTLGVIPFVVIQNVTDGTQSWEGVSDYALRTHLFHRLNVHLDSVENGEQIRNRLMLALIDAEDVNVETGGGVTALRVNSREDGTTDRGAQLISTPLLGGGGGTQLTLFEKLLDLTLESAGVAQVGGANEIFGNEAASSSALQTFYAAQTAVAEHKRFNWLGERPDYGMSALVRKLFTAAQAVDRNAPFTDVDLARDEFDLKLDWSPMFALSAPERQTLGSVAQQANDDGLPPEDIAPVWAQALGREGLDVIGRIVAALKKRQDMAALGAPLRASGEQATGGILGSGQGDGLLPNGGSATRTANP